MARLCRACQTTLGNHVEHCPTCGRHLTENERAWGGGLHAWRTYLDETGWYPHRRDEWIEQRLRNVISYEHGGPSVPRRLATRYLGGHPALSRTGRIVLTRGDDAVMLVVPAWWPARPPRVPVPLDSVRSVRMERTVEQTTDDAVVTAALGSARTGPLGLAFGAAIARRRRVVRTVHVHVITAQGPAELVFRGADEQGEIGSIALMRIFQRL